MILKNKINLIWYGRGNLTQESECDAFDLQSTDGELATRPSALIEVVYKVSATDDGSSGWKEWSSVDYLNGDTIDAEFTKLECGHLYIVIMQGSGEGIKQIDIPEAITASDNPTTTINDEALIISPDNVVENNDDNNDNNDNNDDDVAVVCLPNADDDTWKIFVPSTGDEATAMLNSTSNQIFNYSGMFAGFTMNWKFAMSKSVSFETTEAGDANISFKMNLGADTEVLTIDGKEVANDTKFRMEIVSMTAKDGQENVVGSDVSNPVGCWEGTSVDNVINLTRVEGFEVTEDETPVEDNTNTGNTGNTDETEDDPDIWADETGCLGFTDEDEDGSYRVRFKYNEATVIVTPESDFQITQKTAQGEKLVTDEVKGKLETGIQGAIDAIDSETEESAFKSSVDYSFVFTYASAGETSNSAVQIIYPNNTTSYKVSFDTTFNAADISMKRVMIYDPEREENCATFTEPLSADTPNLFVGAGMV